VHYIAAALADLQQLFVQWQPYLTDFAVSYCFHNLNWKMAALIALSAEILQKEFTLAFVKPFETAWAFEKVAAIPMTGVTVGGASLFVFVLNENILLPTIKNRYCFCAAPIFFICLQHSNRPEVEVPACSFLWNQYLIFLLENTESFPIGL
jgi:hypothetical protein